MQATAVKNNVFVTPDQLLEHWQGHRHLTRKTIEAFPDDKLFTYSIGGMRPFADLAHELSTLAIIGVHGTATGEWKELADLYAGNTQPATKADLLQFWDDVTAFINENWEKIPASRWQETDKAMGQYEMPVYGAMFYWIENENHHRGQGFVYLRSLGIQPPFFWDRGQF
ncbi:DinB family protein [Paraflavitalea sp. CAU 1676]|uniref:DinB family protein n=1 Tax=Paraflavitalea sp. CAU 1676 TaxID=3032598 RepID=UPI0023D98A7B|nr:DinB family protein [Paraflavitalea sp. CAU 1676]MDF2193262.1 DinB family protein [Paraflavitalea sp. CAU 1676]